MKIKKLKLDGPCLIEPKIFYDNRGFLYETWNHYKFLEKKLKISIAQITNAYRSIILGGMKYDADMVNEGQQELEDIMADIMDYNANKPPQLVFIPDLSRLYREAMKAVHPEFRISQTNKKLYAEKKLLRQSLGLD